MPQHPGNTSHKSAFATLQRRLDDAGISPNDAARRPNALRLQDPADVLKFALLRQQRQNVASKTPVKKDVVSKTVFDRLKESLLTNEQRADIRVKEINEERKR